MNVTEGASEAMPVGDGRGQGDELKGKHRGDRATRHDRLVTRVIGQVAWVTGQEAEAVAVAHRRQVRRPRRRHVRPRR